MNKGVFTFLCTCIFFTFSSLQAQDFLIKGKIVDSKTKEPLDATTVYAEIIKDSTLVTYTISDQNGNFELEGKTAYKKLRVLFSYNGYKSLSMEVERKPLVELGTVQLEEAAMELNAVNVVAERVPITIKKDTLEFNSDSFKTRPDATVEDVLKKLPGVEIDTDGKITVNGKEVNQVLVNGQVFFSNDPTVVTKSLPKDIISKIQITDTKTKEQQFSGDAGDGETKTINLTIKEDKNKGYMGRVSAGYGTDDRYQLNGLLNYFNDKKRLSLLAGSNNINNSGFSYDEIFDMVGNSRSRGTLDNFSFGFGQGITTGSNLGASYADQKKDQYEINANYFFAYSDSYNDQQTSRENILPDRRYFTESTSRFDGSTNSNQGSANLQFDIDKTTRISLEPNLSVNRTHSVNRSNTISTNEDGTLINENENITDSDAFQRNFSNRFNIMKRLDTLGGYLRLSFNNNNRENNSTSFLNSLSKVYGDDPYEDRRDQQTEVHNKNDSYEVGLRYRKAIVKNLFLDLEYEYENKMQENLRSVFDLDEGTGEYNLFNSDLSSDFDFKDQQQRPSVGVSFNGQKLRFRVNAEYLHTQLDNQDYLQETSFSKTYSNVLFGSNLSYQLGKNRRISMWYGSNLDTPSVNELQPIPNITNPLNIIVGNPNLSPTVNSRLSLNYNDYNWKDRTGIYAYVGVNSEKDRVVSVTTTDEDLLRTTTYTNVNGNYDGYGGVGFSKQIKKDSVYTVKFNVNPYVNFTKEVSFNNGVRLESKSWAINPRVSTTFNFRELLEVEPGYSIGFNNTKYNLDNLDDVNFISHNISFKTTSYWPENIIWGNDINYTYNGNVGPGYDKDAIFWNMSLGWQLFNKNATVKVLAYDLLNQNINTRRTVGNNYIQDFQGTVLKRYFMFSLSFKFDQFGGKRPNTGGARFFRM